MYFPVNLKLKGISKGHGLENSKNEHIIGLNLNPKHHNHYYEIQSFVCYY